MTALNSTSRVGRKPVPIPAGVEAKVQDQVLLVKTSKGQFSFPLHPFVEVKIEEGHVKVLLAPKRKKPITGPNKKLYKSIAGTTRAQIYNLIHGVNKAFERKLLLVGIGYRAQAKGKILSLSLGFSHPTDFNVPEGIVIETPSQTEIIVKGASKELVGRTAAKIRAIRGPEPYKGKGIRYADETIELKETKKK